MQKSLAALGLIAMTCAACASAPDDRAEGAGAPDGRSMAPALFVSPFGEAFTSDPGEPYPVGTWFTGADADHDGKLSKAEFMADGLRWFDLLDTNKDGWIGPAEITAYESMASRLSGRLNGGIGPARGGGGMDGGGQVGGRPGGRGRPEGPGRGLAEGSSQESDLPDRSTWGSQRTRPMPASSVWSMAGLLNVPQPVKAADVDTNQRITPEEWSRAGDRWFQLLDTNKDGALTLAELPATQMQQRGARGARRGGWPG